MASDRGKLSRKMVAIVHADVTGSTTLVQLDEALAHQRINEAFTRFSQDIEHYGGTVHEIRGDALVAEFPRASDAVCAALTFQESHGQIVEQLDDGIAPKMRVGVSLGEVIVADGQVTGAGVVLAQRVEQLAEPGGLCITGAVHETLPQHMPLNQYDLGEQEVKGFDEAIRVYRVALKPGEVIPPPEKTQKPKATKTLGISAAAALILVIAGGVAFWFQPWLPEKDSASVEHMAFPLPDKPSIAVLPFANMSNDAEQEYFVDGMTEDLITDLSKLSGLFVIARNSVFTYKEKSVKVSQVAEELGVRYVMEGSVRRVGNEVRINAQLIDATTGGHLWAERYDGSLSDVFSLQDQVITRIVAALKIALTDAEQAQLARIPTHNLEAYDYYLRAERSLYQWGSEKRRETLKLYRKAITLDPQFADAYAGTAWAAFKIWRWDQTSVLSPPVARKVAYKMASKTLELDPNNAQAYSVFAYLQVADGEYDEALESIEKAVSLHPNNAEVYTNLAGVLVYAGRHAEALSAMDTAFRLEPIPPPAFHAELGWVLFWNHQYEKAIGPLEKGLEGGVEWWEDLAMTYAKLGRREEAKAMIDNVEQAFPGASLAYYRAASIFKRAEDLEHQLDALREAGLPEWPLGYEAPAGDRLDTASVEALTLGRTWVGKDLANGGAFVLEFGQDRAVAFRGSDSLVVGTAWVEDGMLCIDIPALGVARESCSYLYHNPKGTPEEQNEYVRLGLYEILTFSVRP